MKKVFTLFFAFLALAFSAKAQTTVFSENFDSGMPTGWTQIDANNDGYGWEHSSNPASYFAAGTDLSGTGHNSSTGFVVSGSYSNVYGVLTPDNWLITPAINLTANSTLKFWVCGQDASYAAEHYGVYISTTNATSTSAFTMLNQWTIGSSKVQSAWEEKTVDLSAYTGQTVYIAFRHFNCSDQFVLDLDDVTITANPTTPTILANPASLAFSNVILGNSASATALVTTYNLTAGVTATTAAPFSVSADGTTYGTTATLAATGGTLYVRYTPTVAGTQSDSVVLSSTGAPNATVSLSGNSVDCSNSTVSTLPYTQDFEGGVFPPLCWNIENSDPDTTWEAFSFSGTWASCLGTEINRIEKLITVPFNFSSYTHTVLMDLTFMCNYNYVSNGTVDFKVYASTDGGATWPTTQVWKLSDFGPFDNWTETNVTIDLSSLAGQSNVRFAFVYDGDSCQVLFDDVNIYAYDNDTILLSSNAISFPSTPINVTADADVVVTAYNLTAGITATTTAPFAVSADGTTYGATASIPQAGGTLYVRYAPTAAGTHTGTVTLTSGTTTVNIAVSGEGVDCSNITIPFTEGFESGIPCWTMVSMDPANDNRFGVYADDYAYAGNYDFRFSSFSTATDYNQYLITPELTLTGSGAYMARFFYEAYSSGDQFRVMYSTTNNDISSFTEIQDFQSPATTWTEVAVLLPAGTKYVAINYYGNYEFYLYVDEFSVAPLSAPTVTLNGPSSVLEGSSATFTAVSTLAESFAWTVDGNAVSGTSNTMNYTFTSTGNHTVAVTATNSQGSASASLNVNVYSCGSAVNIPFAENFDGGINECWTILDADGDGYSWESSANPVSYFVPGTDLSGNGHNGSTGFALSGSYSNVTSEALTPNNWLITPMINLSENATLKFWVNAQDANYSAEHYGVYVSTTGTNPSDFTLLFEETIDANGGPRDQGAWKQKTANLSNYTGQTVRIAFRHFNCTDEFVFNLDDVEIVPGVGVENHDLQVKIFPNPANSILNINANSNISKVEVYNLLGQNVMTVSVNDINTNINTSNLTAGMYMLKLHTDNGVINKKFTVAR